MGQKTLKIYSQIILLLSKGISTRKLYYSDHPRVESYAEDIIGLVSDYFALTNHKEIFVGIYDGQFVFEGKRVFGPSVTGKPLLSFASDLQCGGFSFQRGIVRSDLKKFFDVSALKKIHAKKLSDSQALFKQYGFTTIKLGEKYSGNFVDIAEDVKKPWEGQAIDSKIGSPTALYQELYDVVSVAYDDAAFDRSLDLDRTRSVSEFMLKYVQSNFADVMQYVQYPDYTSYTVGHSVRVASLAVFVGSQMGWHEKDLLEIGTAALLHDIGKCKIPDTILMKKGKLTAEEFELVKIHPKKGTEILLGQKNLSKFAVAACWGHHLRYDRGGYHEQPKWAVRHPVSALLQICDVFEALTAVRPYKDALDPHQAYTIMLMDKGGFHPVLLSNFIRKVGIYPPGTYIRLGDGRVAMVLEETEKIARPKLIVVTTQRGDQLYESDQYTIDLSDESQRTVQVDKLLLDYLDM
jgi:HD-GYP domain-containing protein (c-di-GMP phosphodiesterase class II)